MGRRGDDGPPKPNRRTERVLAKTITFDDEDDDGQLPEAPKQGATAAAHMSEGAGFTYGGGGFRGQGQETYSFVKMDEDEDAGDDGMDQEDRMAAKHKAAECWEWQKEQARLREKQLGGKSDKKHKKKDKKKDKKKEKKKDKKAKRRDSSSDTDSDSDSDSDSRSKKAKKSKKDKSDKKDKKDKESSKQILPGRKSDDALVTILREGSSAAEVKQLLTMIDDRQAVLVGGVPPGPRKHLEAFFMSLGMKGKDVPGGPAYVSHSSGGVKLTRHYSHVLEVYKRKQAKAEQEPKPPVLEAAAAPTGPTEEEEDGPTIAVPAAHEPEPRSEEAAMPEAEPAAVIGVAMPPPNSSVSEDEAAVIPKRSMGPALPQGLSREKLESVAEAYRANQEADDDDEGPMLPGEYKMERLMQYEAANNLRDQPVEEKREAWMTVLPDERALGLGAGDPSEALLNRPREFSRKGVQSRGDTSQWTDTPADRERKAMERQLGMIAKENTTAEKADAGGISDPNQGAAAEYSRGHGVKRGPSLLEQHTKGGGKRAKEEQEKKKGFSFDREEDLTIRKGNSLADIDKITAGFRSQFASSGHETGM